MSNHSPSITLQSPSITNRCILSLPCNEDELNKTKPPYGSAMKNSGFNDSMIFEAPAEKARWNSKSKIVWFNLLNSLNFETNICKELVKDLRKHFARSHKFDKVFNLKLVSAIFYQILISHQMLFISSKKLFSFSRYSNFCISIFPSFSPCQPLL